MKNLLKEKNLMWGAIALLTLSSVCLHNQTKRDRHTQRGVVERMRQGAEQRGSRWGGRAEAVKENKQGQRGEGRKKEEK